MKSMSRDFIRVKPPSTESELPKKESASSKPDGSTASPSLEGSKTSPAGTTSSGPSAKGTSTASEAVKGMSAPELRKLLYQTGRFGKSELKKMNISELRQFAGDEIEE